MIKKYVAVLIGKYSFIYKYERKKLHWLFYFKNEKKEEEILKLHIRHNRDFVIKKLNAIKKRLGLRLIGEKWGMKKKTKLEK